MLGALASIVFVARALPCCGGHGIWPLCLRYHAGHRLHSCRWSRRHILEILLGLLLPWDSIRNPEGALEHAWACSPRFEFFHREVVSRWKSEKSDALRCRHASRMLRELGIIAWQSMRNPKGRGFKRHRASARLAWPRFSSFDRRCRTALHAIVIDA